MRKNVAGQITDAHLVGKTDGSDVTTGTTTVYVVLDNGTESTGGGTVAHKGHGAWSYVPTQAETNGNHVAFTFVNTLAVSVTVNVYPVSYDPTDAVRLGLTALPAVAAGASGGLLLSSTWTDALAADLVAFLDAPDLTADDLSANFWQRLLASAAFTTSGSVGAAFKAFLEGAEPTLSDIAEEFITQLGAAFATAPTTIPAPDAPLIAKLAYSMALVLHETRTNASGITLRNAANDDDLAVANHSESGGTYAREPWETA